MIETVGTPEETLLAAIDQTLTLSTSAAKTQRIQALEQLLTVPLTALSRIVGPLCEIVRKLGALEPELTLIVKCLLRAARSQTALDALAGLIDDHHQGALQCSCRLVASGTPAVQTRLGPPLIKELLQRDAIDSVTEALATTLAQFTHPQAKRAVVKEASRHLGSPDALKTRYLVSILSRIGDQTLESGFVTVLGKLFDGYYANHADPITRDLCSYFSRFRSRSAVPSLLRGVEKLRHRCLAETLGAICDGHPAAQAQILKLAKKTTNNSIKYECIYALAAMRKTRPRIKAVAELVTDADLNYAYATESFKQLLVRTPRESRALLIEMLRGNDDRRCGFALEVLKTMNVPMAEVAKSLGSHPVRVVHDFFYSETQALSIHSLWHAKQRLGDNIKGRNVTRFEHLLRTLFSCLGFLTLDVDAAGRPGTDFVAFPPSWSHILVVGATTGVVEDNVQKLANSVRELRAALGKLAAQIQLVSIVATSLSVEPNPKTAEYARRHGVVLLRQADIDRLLDWVNTNRPYATLLSYLEQLTEE